MDLKSNYGDGIVSFVRSQTRTGSPALRFTPSFPSSSNKSPKF